MNEQLTSTKRVIVVGVDGSPSSVRALQLAASLLPLAGDLIRAVTVWKYPLAFGLSTPIEWNYEELAGQALDQALTDAFPTGFPCDIDLQLSHGLAAQTLIEESANASMVVVGSRGHGKFGDLFLGSVSSLVAERGLCPVLICHGASHLPERSSIDGPAEVMA